MNQSTDPGRAPAPCDHEASAVCSLCLRKPIAVPAWYVALLQGRHAEPGSVFTDPTSGCNSASPVQ
jgi:hypothetical protein